MFVEPGSVRAHQDLRHRNARHSLEKAQLIQQGEAGLARPVHAYGRILAALGQWLTAKGQTLAERYGEAIAVTESRPSNHAVS
jgi:hypothetical protein